MSHEEFVDKLAIFSGLSWQVCWDIAEHNQWNMEKSRNQIWSMIISQR